MEAYSYAMICETNGFANYRVDGYDVHPKRLEVGRRGWYHFGWATEIALTDPRIKRGLAFKEHKYGQDVVFIDRLVRDKTKFFQHDISLSPLPRFYDLLVCTNVLRQVQRGGRQDAIENLLRSLKEGGLVIQNYDHFNVDEELKRRVNLSVQHELGLLI